MRKNYLPWKEIFLLMRGNYQGRKTIYHGGKHFTILVLIFSEPRAIQEKLLQGASFCSEVNQLIVRCVTPLKSCFDSAGVSEVANALLHDVVPLDKPMLFKNINQGKNCSEIAKQYAAKSGQPILQSTVCK